MNSTAAPLFRDWLVLAWVVRSTGSMTEERGDVLPEMASVRCLCYYAHPNWRCDATRCIEKTSDAVAKEVETEGTGV